MEDLGQPIILAKMQHDMSMNAVQLYIFTIPIGTLITLIILILIIYVIHIKKSFTILIKMSIIN